MQQALYIIFYAFFFKRKYKQREREREIISLLNKSLSKNFYTIFSPILPNLGRLCFGMSGEKTPKLHQNSLPLSLPTKHSSQQFFVLFSLIPISPPTKHTLDVYVENTKRYLLSNKALGTIDIKSLKGKCVNKSYTCTKFPKSATNLQS